VFKVRQKEFDRSFAISIDEQDVKLKIAILEQDTGNAVMTVAKVAAFLQTD
jgi:hypothetical protein